ncbi:peptidoglycan-binding protein [Actinomycetaceae bacterium L2_0104]
MKRRFWWIGITVVTCVALVATAFVAGRFIRSPNEEAIANSQRVPVVTAEAEERSFPAARTEARGSMALGKSWTVSVAPGDGSLPVVTEVYLAAGDTLHSGSAVASVSGRPVIGLELPFDLYRDIYDGDSGTDVRELQRALQNLGLYSGAIDGKYGARTAKAVKDLYTRANLTPPEAVAQSGVAGPQEPAISQVPAGPQEPSSGQQNAAGPAGGEPQPSSAPGDEQQPAPATATSAPATTTAATTAVTPLLRSEIISLPSNSVTVVSVASVNTHVDSENPLAELRSGQASVVIRVGVGDKDTFPVGTSVNVQASGDTQLVTSGNVGSVGDFGQAEPDKGKDVPGYDITVNVPDPKELSDGQEVLVILGSGEEVRGLAVPITALREDNGKTFVLLAQTKAEVPVTVKMVSEGYAIVEDTTLSAGDDVVVSGS